MGHVKCLERGGDFQAMTDEKRGQTESRTVGSVARALQIIELLIDYPGHELGVTEIARHLGVAKSTAHQLISTLVARGFVDQDKGSARYRLGLRTMEAGAVATANIGIGPALVPLLEKLVAEVRETSSIGVLSSNSVVLLQRVEAESILRVDLKLGTRLPLHNSAVGRMLLSTMPNSERLQVLDDLHLSPEERAETEAAIRDAEAQGCAIVRDIPVDGISAISVPIWNQKRRAVAGLVIAGPTFRFEPLHYRDTAWSAAEKISERMKSLV